MIDKPELLAAFIARLRAADWTAMDTEADSLHSYPEKICLIQLSLPGEESIVDPLSGIDLAPLWEALAGRELLLHGADYDLRMLHRTYRFAPHAVFDTMLAARLLGLPEFGLNNLVQCLLGVHLDKGSQKANWSRRPLTDRMIAYARNDTRYLQPLARLLRARLAEKGRLDWHTQTCAQLVQDCIRPKVEPADGPWRIKGSHRLGRRALAALREIWKWREHEAIAANQPPFFILSHNTLVALAEHASRAEPIADLVPQRLTDRRRNTLRQALDRAWALPDNQLPHPLRRQGHRLSHAQKHQLGLLQRVRDRHAAALGIDPSLIASRSTLVLLAHDWEQHAATLLPWQQTLLKL